MRSLLATTVTFRVYDLNGDGYVSPAELEATLRRLAGQALSADQLAEVGATMLLSHQLRPTW